MKDPAFPLYAQDFLIGTMHLEFSDIGRYIKLLAYQWDNGHIPKKRLGLLVGLEWVNFGFDLAQKFVDFGDFIYNERLEIEREKRRKFKEKQATNGSLGGRPKKESPLPVRGSDNKKPKGNPNKTQTKPKQKPLENENEYENIYEIYNKKWKFDFSEIKPEYLEVINLWLEFKNEKKQNYKGQKSFDGMANGLYELSQGNWETAFKIVQQSIRNNWAGLFELKENGKVSKHQAARNQAYKNTIDLMQRIASNEQTTGGSPE